MKIANEIQLPFYAKVTISLIGLIALFAILYIAKDIIVPILFAILFAIVLHPVVKFLERLRIKRVAAIFITLIIAFLLVALLISFLINQASMFSDTWPQLVEKFTETLNQIVSGASGYLNIDAQKIDAWITNSIHDLINISNAAIGKAIVTLGTGVMLMFLIPLYVFLMLYYQPLILEFIHRLLFDSDQSQVNRIVKQTETVIQSYLVGLSIEAAIVAALNITVLLTLGIEYAVLIGIIGALLNVIPYIGGLVAVALPMIIALATKSSGWYPLYVMAGYYLIQLIDNNYIVPYIVASKVKINALFSIIIVFVGNALWGIAGMFLSIPLLAIVKLLFDNFESVKPWGYLLGDTMPPRKNVKPIYLKRNQDDVTPVSGRKPDQNS